MKSFVLDTGMLLGLVRNAPWAVWAMSEFNLEDQDTMVFTSVICRGEIFSLAEKLRWGATKRSKLEEVMNNCAVLYINDQFIPKAYAMIDAWTRGRDTHPDQAPPPKPALPMSQNDLWVAATAYVSESVLLSIDKDFNRLQDVWIDFIYVDQKIRDSRS